MCHNIKEGAVFISDAHENEKRDYFFRFLRMVDSQEIKPTQLFLMGDMFDLLVGEITYQKNKYTKYIKLIDKIALEIEVFYFEGNHDFTIKRLFKNVKVYSIDMQPVVFMLENKRIFLSHGDKYGGSLHTIYTYIIRNRYILKILNIFDNFCRNCISRKIEKDLLQKNICTKIENFKELIEKKIKNYMEFDVDIIVEGHYHQNTSFDVGKIEYINFSSFACNQSYFIVQLAPDIKFIEKKLRGYDV